MEPGEAEETDWWEQYEHPLAREEAMAESGPMQTEPGRALVCSVSCMSPHCDFDQASGGVGRILCVIRVPFLCFRSCLSERLHCPARFWPPLYRAPRGQGSEHHAARAREVAGCRED